MRSKLDELLLDALLLEELLDDCVREYDWPEEVLLLDAEDVVETGLLYVAGVLLTVDAGFTELGFVTVALLGLEAVAFVETVAVVGLAVPTVVLGVLLVVAVIVL